MTVTPEGRVREITDTEMIEEMSGETEEAPKIEIEKERVMVEDMKRNQISLNTGKNHQTPLSIISPTTVIFFIRQTVPT